MITEVTSSQLDTFKNCRRKYQLSYVDMIKPQKESEALATGSSYHAKVEEILKNGDFTRTGEITDSMAEAFKRYILPQYPEKVVAVEENFRERISRGVYVLGKIDGRTKNYLIEHKTTSSSNLDEYEYKVHFINSQVGIYLMTHPEYKGRVVYDVIKKPTIRQKKNESLEDFLKRCIEWYDTDTDKKIRVFEVYREKDELKDKLDETIKLAKLMKNKKTFFYRNSQACSIFTCPFESICQKYNADELNNYGFIKKESKNEELAF